MCILRYRDLSGGGMQGRLLASVVAGREALRVIIFRSGGLFGLGGLSRPWIEVFARWPEDFDLPGSDTVGDGGEGAEAVRILDEVRAKYGFALVGYVIMPEHVRLLVSETAEVPPSTIVQVFKQRVSREIRGEEQRNNDALQFAELHGELERFWQRRYYDFNIYSREKLREKLEYMHANPVDEHLVQHPREWPWSSWSNYELGEGMLKIDAR
jgi:REP element-mobilizing transposase RayT